MGAKNVKQVYGAWAGLDHLPFRTLAYMALIALDKDDPPVYYAGWEDLAAATGRSVPVEDKADVEVMRERKAASKAVDRVIRALTDAGAVALTRPVFHGNPAEYRLNLKPESTPVNGVHEPAVIDYTGRCTHVTSEGKRCRAWPRPDTDNRCVAHQESTPLVGVHEDPGSGPVNGVQDASESTPLSGPDAPRSVDSSTPLSGVV